jgi:hypothetical protein
MTKTFVCPAIEATRYKNFIAGKDYQIFPEEEDV